MTATRSLARPRVKRDVPTAAFRASITWEAELASAVVVMQRRGAKKGFAALCIGGGMGIAMCLARG